MQNGRQLCPVRETNKLYNIYVYRQICIQLYRQIDIYHLNILCCCSLSRVRLFAALWIVACQAPLSLGLSRQEYWSGLPCPPPGVFLTQRLNPYLICPLHWQVILYHYRHLGSPFRPRALIESNMNLRSISEKENKVKKKKKLSSKPPSIQFECGLSGAKSCQTNFQYLGSLQKAADFIDGSGMIKLSSRQLFRVSLKGNTFSPLNRYHIGTEQIERFCKEISREC